MSVLRILSPYWRLMRLHQRTGIWLLLWPCWWSIALAASDVRHLLQQALLFGVGAVVMRSAGCVINDIWDRKIDPHVERTKGRPLASGELKLWQAVALLVALFAIGLAILLQLNGLTIAVGCVFAVLVVLYPLMKRVMAIPQIFLGLTINAGALMGWSAVTDELVLAPALLYAACFFWTLGYDTIYAHQDKRDDVNIGVKSAALVLGDKTRAHVTAYYALTGALIAAAGWFSGQGGVFYVGAGALLAQLMWQIRTVNLDDSADCMAKFRSNGWVGWLLIAAILV